MSLNGLSVTAGFQVWQHKEGKGEWPVLDYQIDELIQDIQDMLPRCHDANILVRAKWILPRAAFYFGMERWANTAGSEDAYRLMEAYESLAMKQKADSQPESPTVAESKSVGV